MAFKSVNTDFKLSPYTGLTRESWVEAGKYLLTGIFAHIKDVACPVVLPRQETEITYPHLNASEAEQEGQKRAEIFEGLARSFLIAAPLIHNDPEITLSGIGLREYYKSHVLRICTKEDPCYVGSYEDLRKLCGGDAFRTFQQTVETSALVICLWVCREEIWDTYSRAQKDQIAAFLDGFAHGATVPQNWRLFNMLDLAFLQMEGYPIRREVMEEHARAILNYYAGDGWYRDGHSFDYYSCWAFQVYAPVWNLWYGYENMPYIAAQFEAHSNRLMETYTDFFDRDGHTNMWGRSTIYRNASTSAFFGNFLLRNPAADPGLARRICSGSLLQFFAREDFLADGIPTLGFYRQFGPLVYGYSCAESPLWLGKAFLCLYLPAKHPFWTARENNGTWEHLAKDEVKVTTLTGPGLCFSNHEANGATILRTGKVVLAKGDTHGMWNYAKLNFHSQYPWESAPSMLSPMESTPKALVFETPSLRTAFLETSSSRKPIFRDGTPREIAPGDQSSGEMPPCDKAFCEMIHTGAVESQQYVLEDLTDHRYEKANVTFWYGEKQAYREKQAYGEQQAQPDSGRVLYRRQFFDYVPQKECHWMQALDLADVAMPCGILRADRLRLYRCPVRLTLGSYGFPDNGTEIIRLESAGAKAIVLKGTDATGHPKQLAMSILGGWDELKLVCSAGTNPDSEHSIVIYAECSRTKQYDYAPFLLLSQVITKESLEDFSEDEIFPIASIEYTDSAGLGGYGPTTIHMKDRRTYTIDFAGIEGGLML